MYRRIRGSSPPNVNTGFSLPEDPKNVRINQHKIQTDLSEILRNQTKRCTSPTTDLFIQKQDNGWVDEPRIGDDRAEQRFRFLHSILKYSICGIIRKTDG